MTSLCPKSVAVVGGGPVGSLATLYFAKHFSKVTLYELRPGPSTLPIQTNLQTLEFWQTGPPSPINQLISPFQIEESLEFEV